MRTAYRNINKNLVSRVRDVAESTTQTHERNVNNLTKMIKWQQTVASHSINANNNRTCNRLPYICVAFINSKVNHWWHRPPQSLSEITVTEIADLFMFLTLRTRCSGTRHATSSDNVKFKNKSSPLLLFLFGT